MRLILIRHGKAGDRDGWKRAGKEDFDRPLTPAGKKQFKGAAKGLRKLVESIDVLATSPLVRARQTAEIVFGVYRDGPEFLELEVLSGAYPAGKLSQWLKSLNKDAVVACVGHEPDLSHCAGYFAGGEEKEIVEMKKGGVCVIDFEGVVGAGKGKIVSVWGPRDLKRVG